MCRIIYPFQRGIQACRVTGAGVLFPDAIQHSLSGITVRFGFQPKPYNSVCSNDVCISYFDNVRIRIRSRFAALVTLRDLSDESTKEILDGIDDTFIHRIFSPGLLSMMSAEVEKKSFPIDRDVALSIIKERRINPFRRPDMPYPLGITARRLLTPYLAGSIQSLSLASSAIMWKHYGINSKASLIPASAGTLLSILMLIRRKLEQPPHFEKHFPRFQFKSMLGGYDPLTVSMICKYRKFYH